MQVLSGNKQVATAVGSGQIAFGLTDTDDAMGEIDAGSPVTIIYPDREARRTRHAVHPEHAGHHQGGAASKAGAGPGRSPAQPRGRGGAGQRAEAQIPLLKSTEVSARVETPKTVHAMAVDFEAAAKLWDRVAAFLDSVFGGD